MQSVLVRGRDDTFVKYAVCETCFIDLKGTNDTTDLIQLQCLSNGSDIKSTDQIPTNHLINSNMNDNDTSEHQSSRSSTNTSSHQTTVQNFTASVAVAVTPPMKSPNLGIRSAIRAATSKLTNTLTNTSSPPKPTLYRGDGTAVPPSLGNTFPPAHKVDESIAFDASPSRSRSASSSPTRKSIAAYSKEKLAALTRLPSALAHSAIVTRIRSNTISHTNEDDINTPRRRSSTVESDRNGNRNGGEDSFQGVPHQQIKESYTTTSEVSKVETHEQTIKGGSGSSTYNASKRAITSLMSTFRKSTKNVETTEPITDPFQGFEGGNSDPFAEFQDAQYIKNPIINKNEENVLVINEKKIQSLDNVFGKFETSRSSNEPMNTPSPNNNSSAPLAIKSDAPLTNKSIIPNQNSNDKKIIDYSKYLKMKKLNISGDAIRHKMTVDGLSPMDIDSFYNHEEENNKSNRHDDDDDDDKNVNTSTAFSKYEKMRNVGIPVAAIRQKMLKGSIRSLYYVCQLSICCLTK